MNIPSTLQLESEQEVIDLLQILQAAKCRYDEYKNNSTCPISTDWMHEKISTLEKIKERVAKIFEQQSKLKNEERKNACQKIIEKANPGAIEFYGNKNKCD